MRFFITSDADWDSNIDKVVDYFIDNSPQDFFQEKNYGSDLEGVSLFLICRDPRHNFKQRIKYINKEKELYIDVLFNLMEFRELNNNAREKIVAERILYELHKVIVKYEFKNFNLLKFENDLKNWMKKINLI